MTNEVWKSVEGFEGFYEVSNMGRVKALQRSITGQFNIHRYHTEGITVYDHIQIRKEKILTPSMDGCRILPFPFN